MKKKRLARYGLTAILFFVVAMATPAQGITINTVFNSGSSANPSYDPDGSFLTSMMQSVESYWQDIIEDSHTLTVYFYWQDLDIYSTGTLAAHAATGYTYSPYKRESTCTIRFDTASYGSNRNWYFDQDPFDSSEFNLQQSLYGNLSATDQNNSFNGNTPNLLEAGYRGTALSSAPTQAKTGVDMFSVALHEVGHALGMTGGVAINEVADYDYDVNSNLVHGATMAIRTYTTSDVYHVKAGNALMYPYTSAGTRTLPSATDVFAMAATSRWSAIDLPRKDYWGGTSWNTAYNWAGNRIPDSGDEVSVRHGDSVILSGAGVAGKLLIDNASSVDTGAYTLTVGDTTKIDGGSQLIVGNTGGLSSRYIMVMNQSNLNLAGGVVQGNAGDSDLNISADSSLDGAGTLNLDVINYGTMSPGNSAGLVTINGDFTQSASGTLLIELGGLNEGVNSDLLTISGQADLAGLLDIDLIDAFIPSLGDTFTIMTYENYLSGFDAISNWIIGDGLYFAADYQNTEMNLMTLHAIPGDANYDGVTDIGDLGILASHYGITGSLANWEMGDFNNDGFVDVGDLGILAANYNNSNGSIGIDLSLLAPMVPEPSVLGLLTLGALVIRMRRQGK